MFKISRRTLKREVLLPDKTYWHVCHAFEHAIFTLTLATDPAHYGSYVDSRDQLHALQNALAEAYFDLQRTKQRRIKQPIQWTNNPPEISPITPKGAPK